MKYFKSIEELKTADTTAIAQVPGITANVAQNIHNFFEKENEK
jgi:ERCC4-type nuclease